MNNTATFAVNIMDQKDYPLTDQEFIQRAEQLFEESVASMAQESLRRLEQARSEALATLVADTKHWF